MSRIKTMTRRALMFGVMATAGGVAFGIYRVKTPHDNPLLAQIGPGEASFNPFVRITSQGITLITPHADIGQGAASMQAMLIAEELDLELGQFEIETGAPDPAYFNTAMAEEAVPFMSTDTGTIAEAARSVIGAAIKLAGFQVTGGSTSVPDSFDKLRVAGAVARETLKAVAADMSGLPAETLKTDAGAVVFPDGHRVPYVDLAAAAAETTPVTDVVLREPEEWRLIGKPVQRLDIVDKSTGQQDYTIDLRMEGMVHASVRLNPHKGGALLSYDANAADAMSAVIRVLPVTGGVAVIAQTTWDAFQALDAIEYDWAPASYPAEQDDHWAQVSAAFTPNALDKVWRDDGNVAEQGNAGVNVEYRAPYVAHQPLEPLAAVALVTGTRADVWAAHQIPRIVEQRVAQITGLDEGDVFFHNQFAGGSFGHRLEFANIDCVAEIAVQMPGVPVKMTFSREEDFAQDFTRQIGMARAKGTVRDGHVHSLDLEIATPSVIRSQMGRVGLPAPGPDIQIAAGAWNMPYAIPHLRVAAYAVPGLAPVSSWRSVGASTAGFFVETALDEVIHAAGADPMEERLRLINDPIARGVLEAVGDMSNWGGALEAGRGRGVALVNSFGVPVAEVVEVTQTGDGVRIDNVFVAADVGRVVDPVNFENIVQGGVIWGLGHAINSEITYSDGQAEQSNYHVSEGMRLYQTPKITVRALEQANKIRGIGEPPVPPAAPALGNAIFAATGLRLREMPFHKFIDFV